MTTTTDKTVIKLNASALKESACSLRTFNTMLKGYTTAVNSNDIEYGTAFHLFVSEMRKNGGNFQPATKLAREYFNNTKMDIKPTKKWLNEQHLIATCFNYWEANGGGKDGWDTVQHNGEFLVEQKFALPYYVDDEVEVLLVGTMDDICKRQGGGCYAVRDYKTTSVYDIESYFKGYALSPQLIFYIFVIQRYAEMFPDSIFATEICKQNPYKVGAFIDGIFVNSGGKDGVAKPLATFAKSDITFFTKEQMDEFKQLLDAKVAQIVHMAKMLRANPTWEPLREGMINGACQTVYGVCKFFDSCAALDSVCRGHLLKNKFIIKPYDPLNFH